MSEAGPAPARSTPALIKVPGTRARLRLAAQIVFFALFVFLISGTQQELKTGVRHDLFFLADPLAGLSAMLAGRSLIGPMLIGSVAVLIATLVLGRAWCGWVCPLGSLLDWIPGRKSRMGEPDMPRPWRQGKNLSLFVIIFGALLGSLTIVALDPVTILFRSLAGGLMPMLNSLILAVDTRLYHIGPMQAPVAWFDSSVRAALLGDPGFYLPNLTLLVLLVGILALNAVRRRFWCRYACLLGALLGLVARVSLFRHRIDRGKCISCSRCATGCPTHAVDSTRGYMADAGECIACLECVENCPTRAISFQAGTPPGLDYQPGRRHFLQSMGAAAIGAATLAIVPALSRKRQTVVRPPGSTEDSLEEKCVRCGECIRVCPTGSIQPDMSAGNWDKTWSPQLVMRRGYCDYSCNACGKVCPTGAIASLTLEKKRTEVIGVAAIDKDTCIPFDEDRECIVCEEMCPLPEKAVILETQAGRKAARPRVLRDVCTGCGICEEQCPINGRAAIRVFPPGTIPKKSEDG